jgi:hypothetical protein
MGNENNPAGQKPESPAEVAQCLRKKSGNQNDLAVGAGRKDIHMRLGCIFQREFFPHNRPQSAVFQPRADGSVDFH